MLNRIFSHWKTSLAGIVLAFGQYLVAQGSAGFTWETFLPIIGTILLGLFAQDK